MLSTAAVALLAASLQAAPPSFDVALARRTGTFSAELTLRQADPRLMAQCFDPDGIAPESVEAARQSVIGRPVWLYLGPRRVARGRIESLDSAPDRFLPCVVAARAVFDVPLPLTAASDVLWASTAELGSSPREPADRGVAEKARKALPADIAAACLRKSSLSVRGTRAGAYVSLVCPAGEAQVSAIVLVPPKAEPQVVAIEQGSGRGSLSLLEVLDPREQSGHRLVLARALPRGRHLELWRCDGRTATPMEAETLFLDSLELAAQEEAAASATSSSGFTEWPSATSSQ